MLLKDVAVSSPSCPSSPLPKAHTSPSSATTIVKSHPQAVIASERALTQGRGRAMSTSGASVETCMAAAALTLPCNDAPLRPRLFGLSFRRQLLKPALGLSKDVDECLVQ